MPEWDIQFLLALFGIVFIAVALLGMAGIWKRWYWRSKRRVYVYLPIGVVFILAAFEDQIRASLGEYGWVLIVAYAVLLAIAIWFLARPPEFIKPEWIRIIESHPPYVYEEMSRQALSGNSWEHKVRDEASLKAWIREVQRKKPKSQKK